MENGLFLSFLRKFSWILELPPWLRLSTWLWLRPWTGPSHGEVSSLCRPPLPARFSPSSCSAEYHYYMMIVEFFGGKWPELPAVNGDNDAAALEGDDWVPAAEPIVIVGLVRLSSRPRTLHTARTCLWFQLFVWLKKAIFFSPRKFYLFFPFFAFFGRCFCFVYARPHGSRFKHLAGKKYKTERCIFVEAYHFWKQLTDRINLVAILSSCTASSKFIF